MRLASGTIRAATLPPPPLFLGRGLEWQRGLCSSARAEPAIIWAVNEAVLFFEMGEISWLPPSLLGMHVYVLGFTLSMRCCRCPCSVQMDSPQPSRSSELCVSRGGRGDPCE